MLTVASCGYLASIAVNSITPWAVKCATFIFRITVAWIDQLNNSFTVAVTDEWQRKTIKLPLRLKSVAILLCKFYMFKYTTLQRLFIEKWCKIYY